MMGLYAFARNNVTFVDVTKVVLKQAIFFLDTPNSGTSVDACDWGRGQLGQCDLLPLVR